MKFKVICKNKGDSLTNAWEESYNREEVTNAETALAWAQETIGQFNASLRPHEIARDVVGVRLEAGEAELPHQWRKSNLVTISPAGGGTSYDTYRCERCGATGKRFGLSDNIHLDKQHAKKRSCPGS